MENIVNNSDTEIIEVNFSVAIEAAIKSVRNGEFQEAFSSLMYDPFKDVNFFHKHNKEDICEIISKKCIGEERQKYLILLDLLLTKEDFFSETKYLYFLSKKFGIPETETETVSVEKINQ